MLSHSAPVRLDCNHAARASSSCPASSAAAGIPPVAAQLPRCTYPTIREDLHLPIPPPTDLHPVSSQGVARSSSTHLKTFSHTLPLHSAPNLTWNVPSTSLPQPSTENRPSHVILYVRLFFLPLLHFSPILSMVSPSSSLNESRS